MYQRSSDRDPALRSSADRRVGLFIDYESVRRGIEEPPGGGEAADLAQRLRDLAHEQGRVLVAAAYGDWGGCRGAARDFRRFQIETRMVLGREPGDDRTDLVLCLDVLETLFLGPDLDVFVVVAGESTYQELIQRLRRADKNVVLVAFDSTLPSQTYRGGDRFVPLEELLGVKRAKRPGKPAPTAALDWAPFVRLMEDLEKNMPFVGFGWLLKKKLNPENSGCHTIQEKQELMDRSVEDGVLVLYKVDNIEEGADPVTACKLNRDNPLVKGLVEP